MSNLLYGIFSRPLFSPIIFLLYSHLNEKNECFSLIYGKIKKYLTFTFLTMIYLLFIQTTAVFNKVSLP